MNNGPLVQVINNSRISVLANYEKVQNLSKVTWELALVCDTEDWYSLEKHKATNHSSPTGHWVPPGEKEVNSPLYVFLLLGTTIGYIMNTQPENIY
jgi:hypothetical protein